MDTDKDSGLFRVAAPADATPVLCGPDGVVAEPRRGGPSVSAPLRQLAQRGHESGTAIEIAPQQGWVHIDLRELWAYRELFFFLVWRDLKVRYAQTVLGAGWVVLQPVVTMVVFTIVFGRLARIPSDGVPYALFSLAALIPWHYFSGALTATSISLVSNRNLITKVYFPRLVIPFASLLSGLVNFAITFGLLLVVLLAAGMRPNAVDLLFVPLVLLVMILAAGGVGCWLAALGIQYRDIAGITGFIVQVWMYASPVVYPLSLVPEAYRPLYLLNPMAGVIEGFRSILLGTHPLSWTALAASAAIGLLLFVTGALYFRRQEHIFADVA